MSIRARLALWYGTLLALVLAVALGSAYFAHQDEHIQAIDAELTRIEEGGTLRVASAYAEGRPLGTVELSVPGHDHGLYLADAASGRVLASAGTLTAPAAERLRVMPDGAATSTVHGQTLRVLVRAVDGVPNVRLVATTSLAALENTLGQLRILLLSIALAGVSVALVGGWAIAGGALRPVALLTGTARAIARSREFARRLPIPARRDELGELARTLNDMLASLDAAYELEQRFVSDASHELRTPLTTVHANAELLVQDDADPVERREAARQILREAARLSRLVGELLAIARADAETEPLQRSRVELDEVLMEAFAELRTQTDRRLRVVALDEAPVAGDRGALKQVVLTLIDNALRYTPSDRSIDVSVGIEDGSAALRVDDDGIGMDATDEAHAFERFYRGRAARKMAPDGTGLGLAIARWIVERHGGTIQLRPRAPRGTSAVVRLPLARGTAPTAARDPAAEARPVPTEG